MSLLRKENLLFLSAVFVEFFLCFYLIHDHRVPADHDGFQYFSLQYYFLNDSVGSGGIPQWMPFMTQGTVASWWYALQAGILQNAAFMTGSVLKDINFISIFNVGIFFDKLILLTGVWLLSRRFFASPYTSFFVSLTVMLSSIWMLQPWFNFHFYFAIPLILHFFHVFWKRGQWRYFFLGGNLLLLQSLGTILYHLPVVSLVIFLYFLFYFVSDPGEWRKGIKRIRLNAACLACLLALSGLLAAVYYVMSAGTSEIVTYNFGRNADQTQSLHDFLTYSGNFVFKPWLEVLLGISPAFDYTLYMGALPVPLVILGLIPRGDKKNIHFICLALIILLFSGGGMVASFFYYVWPMMKLYRHLSLLGPIIKFFLCFIAGFGWDLLFDHAGAAKAPQRHRFLCVSAFSAMSIIVVFLSVLCLNPVCLLNAVNGLVSLSSGLTSFLYTQVGASIRLNNSLLYAAGSLAVLALIIFIRERKQRDLLLWVAIGLQLFNLLFYNISETRARTVSINKEGYAITAFQPMPFARRRDIFFWSRNPRENFLNHFKDPGMLYWSTHSFLFKDQAHNPFKTDHWLGPLDSFMRVYWGQSIEDRRTFIRGLDARRRLLFPLTHPASGKIAGISEDKIQFFSKGCYAPNEKDAAFDMIRPEYKGDIIFLSGPPASAPDDALILRECSDNDLSQNARLPLPYKILKFSANNLLVSVNVPLGYGAVWMLYSDVWHPGWKARVNGKPSEVFKANLAYKSVRLEPGANTVLFSFYSRFIAILHRLIGVNSLFWIGAVLFYLGRIGFRVQPGVD